MMIRKIFCLSLLVFSLNLSAQYAAIENYRTYFGVANYKGKQVALIRSYDSGKKQYFVSVGFDDIKTSLIPAEAITPVVKDWSTILAQYSSTPYIKAINAATKQSLPMQDAGIQHGNSKGKGIALTIDLCPSHKSLDRIIFTSIVKEFGKSGKPEPIGLSITGKFLEKHTDDIEWLKKMEQSGAIEIVWINHTFNHRYNPKLPLKENFLLEPGTNLDAEILLLEKNLLEKEILFSAFFRFPGLVSDSSLVTKVTHYGLIPIGSDAWLAKGQTAQNGDIVLIHGNGNEPLGVKDFLELLQKKRKSILKKQWLLYDLREDIDEEFEQNPQ